MTDSLLSEGDKAQVATTYALIRQAMTWKIIEKVHDYQKKKGEAVLGADGEEPPETPENLSLKERACFTSVAFCVELQRLVPVEEVPKYQAEYGPQGLTFKCPECHTPLSFLLMNKEFTAQSYFVQDLSLQKQGKKSTAKHGLCVVRHLEKDWIEQVPTETLRKILAFYDVEVNIKHAIEELSDLKQSMTYLGKALEAFQTVMPALQLPEKGREKSTDKALHNILADFAMMSELQKKHTAFFDKEGQKILKSLGHLEETYVRFRQKIRHY